MERLTALANKYLPPHISIPLILHIVILSGILYIGNFELLENLGSQKIYEKIPILTITATVILLYLVLLASYVFLCLKIRKDLKPRFGALWDKNKEPYCPIHEKPLTRHKVRLGGTIASGLNCTKCSNTIMLIDDEGKRLTLPEAKILL